jgi:hypothetical protein
MADIYNTDLSVIEKRDAARRNEQRLAEIVEKTKPQVRSIEALQAARPGVPAQMMEIGKQVIPPEIDPESQRGKYLLDLRQREATAAQTKLAEADTARAAMQALQKQALWLDDAQGKESGATMALIEEVLASDNPADMHAFGRRLEGDAAELGMEPKDRQEFQQAFGYISTKGNPNFGNPRTPIANPGSTPGSTLHSALGKYGVPEVSFAEAERQGLPNDPDLRASALANHPTFVGVGDKIGQLMPPGAAGAGAIPKSEVIGPPKPERDTSPHGTFSDMVKDTLKNAFKTYGSLGSVIAGGAGAPNLMAGAGPLATPGALAAGPGPMPTPSPTPGLPMGAAPLPMPTPAPMAARPDGKILVKIKGSPQMGFIDPAEFDPNLYERAG